MSYQQLPFDIYSPTVCDFCWSLHQAADEMKSIITQHTNQYHSPFDWYYYQLHLSSLDYAISRLNEARTMMIKERDEKYPTVKYLKRRLSRRTIILLTSIYLLSCAVSAGIGMAIGQRMTSPIFEWLKWFN